MESRIIDTTGRSIPVTVEGKNFLVQEGEAQKQMRRYAEWLQARGVKIAPTGEAILEADNENRETD